MPMKHVVLYAFVTCAFVACGQKNKSTDNEHVNVDKEVVITPLQSYSSFLAKKDTTQPESVTAAAKEFGVLFADTDTTVADSAFVLFNTFYNSVADHVAAAHIKDPKKFNSFNVPGKLPDTSNAYVASLQQNGFTLEMAEGNSYVKQDYSFMQQYFYPHISNTLKNYLLQINRENKEGFLSDAALVVEPVDLVKRILYWEQFLAAHPMFYFNDNIRHNKRAYTTFLLEGTDNTPVIKHGSDKIHPAYRNAYEQVISVHPKTELAALVRPYYQALQKKDQAAVNKILQRYKQQGIIFDHSA